MMNLNERAWGALQGAADRAEELGILVSKAGCGTLIFDCGVHAPGGLGAGLLMAEIGMAGLASARLEMADAAGMPWTWVVVHSDHLLQACFLSQSAHWAVQEGAYRAMGSGPACLLHQGLNVGQEFGYVEKADHAVLVLEAPALPDETVCRSLAASCGVDPANLAIMIAPTASLAGSAQIAARALETALHKLHHLGFDLRRVVSGMGRCPVAAPTGDDLTALGRTNDMVFFCASVILHIQGTTDEELARLVQELPSSKSPAYGKPFLLVLKEAGGFYQVDPGLFAPAEATLISLSSGTSCHAGGVDNARLLAAVGRSGNG
jgi:methenyltetrahydromethanopterin cyclohydrolase